MIPTHEDIQHALGDKYDPTHEYVLARAADVPIKTREGWTLVGTLPDATETGTMKIMSRLTVPK